MRYLFHRYFVYQKHGLVLFLAALAMLLVPMASAQYRASIQGVVEDPQGAVIPGADVKLVDTATNLTLTTKSDANGEYHFNALPASHFNLTVTMSGFQAKTLQGVQIIPEQANVVNVQLGLGDTHTEVTVHADALPSLDTATASLSGTISDNQLEHMPAIGRDVTQLVQLAPGVFGDGSQAAGGGSNQMPGSNTQGTTSTSGIFKTENAPQIVANGGQNNSNGIMIDGISTESAVWGGSTVITPSADSVESVKVTSNAYDAEFGRFSGAQIQITSKSGSNDFHGSLFFKAERPGLNAYQRWNGPNSTVGDTPAEKGLLRDSARFNQFGGSAGGPIWKDRLFAFFAYETLRNNSTAYANAYYETPQFLASAPSGSVASAYASYPGEGVHAVTQLNTTCSLLGLTEGQQCQTVSGGVDIGSPLTLPLGTPDPTYTGTNSPGVGSGLDGVPDLGYYQTSNPTQITQTQYNGRLDANATSKDHVSFAIYWVPQSTENYMGPIRAANAWNHEQVNDALTVLWNHTFSATLLNEARVNAAGWRWNEIDTNPNVPFGLASANIGTAPNGLFPQGTGVNPQYLGAPGPSTLNQWTYGYQDILTKIMGRHTFKFGGSLTRLYYLNSAPYAARPSFIFANMWDFLNDAPYSESGSFNPATGTPTANREDDRQNLWAGFVQDDWKVTPNLILNLGLRYSYNGPLTTKQNNLSVVELGAGSAMISGITMRQGGSLYDVQKGNFGPQVGFAWNPSSFTNKMVVRGGFGVNYNQNEIAITANGGSNSPNVLSQTLLAGQLLYQLPTSATSLYGYPSNPNAVSAIGANGLPTTTNVGVGGFDAKAKTIYTYHYSLDTQADLGHNWVATVGYQGSIGRHLLLQQNMEAIAAVEGYALNPNLSSVDVYSNKGNSNYNALLASIKHNFSRSFQLEGQYAWSKSMDNGSQPYYTDPYPFDLKYSYGRSDYNVQDAFKIFGMWQPTFFHGNNWAHSLADNWTVTGIFNWHTGFPWTPTVPIEGGSLYYRNSPYGTTSSPLLPASYNGRAKRSTSNDAFKAAAGTAQSNFPDGGTAYFTTPTYTAVPSSASILATAGAPQAPGIARNSFDGPGYKDVDASIAKGFGLPKMSVLGDKARIEFRADAFNLFNNLNIDGTNSSLTTNITSSNFGQAARALGSRLVDIQARFSF